LVVSVRCANDQCPPMTAFRRRLEGVHANLRIIEAGKVEDHYNEQLARPRATAAIGGAFAIIALAAAGGGLLSVLTYAVNRRRREFGIRSALGASASEIRGLVLRDGLMVTGIGLAVGVLAAWWLAQGLTSMQYGVSAADPVTWLIVVSVISATTLAAAWRPARQAMRTNPVALLREE
jgi:putative ABC transport system permease protein